MISTARHFVILLAIVLVECGAAHADEPHSNATNPAIEAATSPLRSLTHLKADEWRYHVGDVPHGEDVALDDSGWAVVKNKSDAPVDAVWYRRWMVVPPTLNGYDLTGTKLWFQFSLLFSTMSWNGPGNPAAFLAAPMRLKSRFWARNVANCVMKSSVASSGMVTQASLPVSLTSSAMCS